MCNKSKEITELNIYTDNEKNIFNCDNSKYIIPLYQRAFAWREKEICQLISDINDYKGDGKYYLGTLIVSKRSDSTFEVIDGQQRLTALFILLNCLGISVKKDGADSETAPLSFECREKSNKTLLKLCTMENPDEDEFEAGISLGRKIAEKEISETDKDSFIEKLKKVILFRIEVPPHTDLNRYFEVMNTRGEQLEQHDVIKAKLMEALSDDKRERFALIWDACSDMDGYVQMNFSPDLRELLFGNYWNQTPQKFFEPIISKNDDSVQNKRKDDSYPQSIKDIISKNKTSDASVTERKGFDDIRFESIIGFPHFLLHVLKVYVENACTEETCNLLGEQTDDKKLFDSFNSVISYGKQKDGKIISDNIAEFSESFIKCLILCRFVFDKYIIKREYNKNDSLGKWSLKELDTTGQQSNKKAYYKNTYIGKYVPRSKSNEILMLQACLRVSYISAKSMHWITKLLNCLYGEISKNNSNLKDFPDKIDKVASTAVKDAFFDKDDKALDTMGVNTQNIVFNYLDYLLWKEDGGKKYGDFVFEFRNSVEHWYPQNPSEGSFEKWDKVDRFGNLCLTQRQINSKFSNLSPEAKNTTYPEMIAKGSIKLRKMAEIIQKPKNGQKSKSEEWKDGECESHEKEMIKILEKACGIQ